MTAVNRLASLLKDYRALNPSWRSIFRSLGFVLLAGLIALFWQESTHPTIQSVQLSFRIFGVGFIVLTVGFVILSASWFIAFGSVVDRCMKTLLMRSEQIALATLLFSLVDWAIGRYAAPFWEWASSASDEELIGAGVGFILAVSVLLIAKRYPGHRADGSSPDR